MTTLHLGVDLGGDAHATAWALLDGADRVVEYHALRLGAATTAARYQLISERCRNIQARHGAIVDAAVEGVFWHPKRPSAAAPLLRVQTLWCLAIERTWGIVPATPEPSHWRSVVGIHCRDRDQAKAAAVQMVKLIYGQVLTDDEAEAILIGRATALEYEQGRLAAMMGARA